MLKQLCLLFCLLIPALYFVPTALAEEDPYFKARMLMVEKDIAGRGVSDERVLAAMRGVERHLFIPPESRRASYSDHPLPIEEGQTISQPYIVALMTEKLELSAGMRALEVGTGSGYQAAILAEMGMEVRSIEIREGLAKSAAERLKSLGYEKVKVRYGDGYYGWEEEGPFDAVIVTAAANHIPPPLINQLKEGGRLIIPLGSTTYYQTLTLARKLKARMDVEHISGVVFVPMTGKMLEERK
ncbi:MAG: protein-L-isoaspartate(D-aspartate) O-methyltransferase [bacterium]|nr:protein-L-isoaspartate(D-aspartate) O-methyltransferase [bacterium]